MQAPAILKGFEPRSSGFPVTAMFRGASNNSFISVDISNITQVFCLSRYRLSIHGLCLSVILYSCMEQLITEAAALNLAQLSALKCLQQMTHALDVSKRQQSL